MAETPADIADGADFFKFYLGNLIVMDSAFDQGMECDYRSSFHILCVISAIRGRLMLPKITQSSCFGS